MVKNVPLLALSCVLLTACASMGEYGVKPSGGSQTPSTGFQDRSQTEDQALSSSERYVETTPLPAPPDAAPITVESTSPTPVSLLANNRYPIRLPWPDGGVGTYGDLRGVVFSMTECKQAAGLFASILDEEMLDNYRTVQVIVPGHLDLLDAKIANTVLVQSLHEAWATCPLTHDKRLLFSGVKINVLQNSRMAITAGRSKGPYNQDGQIWFGDVKHILYEQTQREEQERQIVAERTASDAAWASFWFKVRIGFYAILAVAALWFGAKFVPPVLTRVAWFFFPHPAIAEIKSSMRHGDSRPVDGDRLADALDFKPRNPTEAELAKRDIEDLKKHVRSEREYRQAEEELARAVIDAERARQRVEELKTFKGKLT